MQVFVTGGGSPSSVLDDITAEPEQVLMDYTYNDSDGEKKTGKMVNCGAINTSVAVGDTYTNNTTGYYTSITVKGPTLSGSAAKENVLNGKTFYSNSGTKQTGSMNNYGAINTSVAVNGSYTGSAGYYSSIKVAGPALSGDAAVGNVLSGKTFYSNSGTKQTGTMVNRGAASGNLTPTGGNTSTKTISAGYYSGGSVTATGYQVKSVQNVLVNGSWQSINIGVTPKFVGISPACIDGKRGIKYYVSGQNVHHTYNSSGTYCSNCTIWVAY